MKAENIVEFLENRFSEHMLNFIYFTIGLGIGMILFLLVFLIIFLLCRQHEAIKNIVNIKNVVIKEEYKEIIEINNKKYHDQYKDASIKNKLVGIGNILFDMLNSIASLYYPNSDDPIFEISPARLVEVLGYITKRIDYVIDHLLEERLSIIDRFTKYSIKDKKISFVFELINKAPEKVQEEQRKKSVLKIFKSKISKVGTKFAKKYGGNIINKEVKDIILDLGEDINKIYSGQELEFTDISFRNQARNLFLDRIAKRKLRKQEKVGDNNA